MSTRKCSSVLIMKKMITRVSFFFIILGFVATTIKATPYYIRGTIKDLNNKKVYLKRIYKLQDIQKAVTKTDSNGGFTFKLDESYPIGMYKISFDLQFSHEKISKSSEKKIYIIYNQQNIDFHTKIEKLYNNLEFVQSQENQIYYQFLRKNRQFLFRYKTARRRLRKTSPDDNNWRTIKSNFVNIQQKRRQYINELIEQHPDKFVSRIIQSQKIPIIKNNLNERSMRHLLHAHFLDPIDFNDSLLLRTPVLKKKWAKYLKLHKQSVKTQQQIQLYKKAIDTILTKASVNPQVYQYAIQFLFDYLEKYGNDQLITHIGQVHQEIKATRQENIISEEIKQKLSAYKKVSMGKQCPNIAFNDILNGQHIQLNQINADYTLIIFWSKSCPHCTKLIPELQELYQQYDREYFQVISIGIEKRPDLYKDYLKEKGYTEWINYSSFRKWEGTYVNRFNVHHTPSMFLLNQDKIITDKPDKLKELKKHLKENQ